MIAIEVELLTGRFVATRFDDRGAPEWPPHPARLFSALVATLHELEEPPAEARFALEWLEMQGPPHVAASEAERRVTPTTFVPGNMVRVLDDLSRHEQSLEAARSALEEAERSGNAATARRARKAAENAEDRMRMELAKAVADDRVYSRSACADAEKMLPGHRGRQPKELPSVTPAIPRVRYVWPEATPEATVRRALLDLTRRLVRLGHSSTLVSCRLTGDGVEAELPVGMQRWIPTDDGTEFLRDVAPRQLQHLEIAHARHRGVDPRVLPARHQPYQRRLDVAEEPAPSVFGEWLILREVAPPNGSRLGLRLTRVEDVTRAVRGALLHYADDPPPAVLSGHMPTGSPLEGPHVAFVVLADVGSPWSSGAVLGVAILLPRGIEAADRLAVLRAVGRWERAGLRLLLGRAGFMHLERVVDRDPRRTLDPAAWTQPSHRWASVTPVALDENPGDLAARDPMVAARAAGCAEEIVARACERIGLPAPAWVQVMRRSLFEAVPVAWRFMPYPRNGSGLKRVCVHVEVRFEEPVGGPVVLGAGRYFGVGLCRARGESTA